MGGAIRLLCLAVVLAGVSVTFLLQDRSKDEVTGLCELSALYRDCERTFTVSSASNIRRYVDSCKAVWPSFGKPAQNTLLQAYRDGQYLELLSFPRKQKKMQETTPDACGAAWGRKTQADLEREFGKDADAYRKKGFYPLKEETIHKLSEVQKVWQRAGVARIDGMKLLPKRMFNVTLQDLAALHPGTADSIDAFNIGGYKDFPRCFDWLMHFSRSFHKWGPDSLRTKAAQHLIIPALLAFACPKPAPSLAELAGIVPDLHEDEVPWVMMNDRGGGLGAARTEIAKRSRRHKSLGSTNINLRRLPGYHQGLDLTKTLGIHHLVESTQSLMWMGLSPGGFHNDQQDNVLIQLSGSAEVLVIPPNCSIQLHHIKRHDTLAEWLKRDVPKKGAREGIRAPFFHVRLTAGQALVIPSMAVHKVLAKNSRRIAVNAFFEPKFGRMRWPGAPNNFYTRHDSRILAMRSLWLRSLSRLFDEHGVGIAMHTERIEFL